MQYIGIKSAFLQSHFIDRKIFVKPPKQPTESLNKVWNLNATNYGLSDASRS